MSDLWNFSLTPLQKEEIHWSRGKGKQSCCLKETGPGAVRHNSEPWGGRQQSANRQKARSQCRSNPFFHGKKPEILMKTVDSVGRFIRREKMWGWPWWIQIQQETRSTCPSLTRLVPRNIHNITAINCIPSHQCIGHF